MNTTECSESVYACGGNSSWTSSPSGIVPEVYYIQIAGIVPVACLGLLGNLAALVVWMAEIKYNASTLLLKVLCVWDSMFLLTFAITILRSADKFVRALIFAIGLSQLMSAHVTLTIAVTRLLAVIRPLHVRSILTRRLVHVVHVGIMVWCVVLQSLEMVWNVNRDLPMSVRWALFVSRQTVGFVLPLTALLVVNICLLGFLERFRTISRRSLQRRPSNASMASDRRLNLAVICISLCSLIAYPVGIILELVTEAAYGGLIPSLGCDHGCVLIVDAVFHLLQVLNSSVNIIFYMIFSTQFRRLLVSRAQRVRGFGRSLLTISSFSSIRKTGVTGV